MMETYGFLQVALEIEDNDQGRKAGESKGQNLSSDLQLTDW